MGYAPVDSDLAGSKIGPRITFSLEGICQLDVLCTLRLTYCLLQSQRFPRQTLLVTCVDLMAICRLCSFYRQYSSEHYSTMVPIPTLNSYSINMLIKSCITRELSSEQTQQIHNSTYTIHSSRIISSVNSFLHSLS